jgi:hypothetical protein
LWLEYSNNNGWNLPLEHFSTTCSHLGPIWNFQQNNKIRYHDKGVEKRLHHKNVTFIQYRCGPCMNWLQIFLLFKRLSLGKYLKWLLNY